MHTVLLVVGIGHFDCDSFVGVAQTLQTATQIAVHKYNTAAGNTGADVLAVANFAELQALHGLVRNGGDWGEVYNYKS